jgi:HEAT repeat protein
MFVALMAIPAAVAAQTPPPTPPAPPAPPMPAAVIAPPAVPLTPMPPGFPALAPLAPMPALPAIDVWAMEDALMAGQAARIDASMAREAREAAREATMQAREALDHARLITPRPWSDDFHFEYQNVYSTSQGDSRYSGCLSSVSQRKYDEAIVRCDQAVQQKGTRTDAALYWKAYSQYMVRKNDDALATIALLRKDHPQSRYLQDAKVLENAVRRVDPTTLPDDDLKLLAIQAMQHQEPEKAIPLLEGVLNAPNSLQVKRRALYVLAQSTQPRAHTIILNYAKGQGSPDLQVEAIRYLRTTSKDRQVMSNELRQIYESTPDLTVRRAIISAYTETWDRNSLVTVASTPGTPTALRTQAISGLSNVAAPSELWTLYTKETDKDLKMHMVSAFGSMQAQEQLSQIVRTEKDPQVRARAVRALGNLKPEQTGKMLADLYNTDQDLETRKAVVSALAGQNNVESLITIARKETNRDLRLAIVERLSSMAQRGSKPAADYLMEIIR